MSDAPEADTIAILFDRDPTQLSDQDIAAIVDFARKGRARFITGELQAGSVTKTKTAKAKANKGLEKELDLGDLGL